MLGDAIETNRVWAVTGNEGDSIPYRNGRPIPIEDVSTEPRAFHRYRGVTAALSRHSGAVRLLGAYTWSGLETASDSLAADHTHQVVLSAAWAPAAWASFGLAHWYLSGAPLRPRFRTVGDAEGWNDYRARVGTMPAPPPDREALRRRPAIRELAFQARAARPAGPARRGSVRRFLQPAGLGDLRHQPGS